MKVIIKNGRNQTRYLCLYRKWNSSQFSEFLDPNIVLETVNLGLDKWNKLTMDSRYLPIGFNPVTSHRWEDSFEKMDSYYKEQKLIIIGPSRMITAVTGGIWTIYGSTRRNESLATKRKEVR